MSKVPIARPIPVGLLVTNPSRRTRPRGDESAGVDPVRARGSRTGAFPLAWLRVAASAALGMIGMIGVGLLVIGFRPVEQSVTESGPLSAISSPGQEVLPPPVPAAEAKAVPTRVEPCEARPPFNNVQIARVEEPAHAVVAPPEPITARLMQPPACERFGTAIDFVPSQSIAFDWAARQQKLVLTLHLAGNFEDPGFT